jgi:hypothetical protein
VRSLLVSVAAISLAFAAAPAHATFMLDTSCGQSKCAAGTKMFLDTASKDVVDLTATVGGHNKGPAVDVNVPSGADTTGAGFATIKPAKGTLLTVLNLIPADDTLFNDFSFRNQLERSGFGTGTIHVNWTDSSGTTGTVVFNDTSADQDSDRLGIVSDDGETLKEVTLVAFGGDSFKEIKQIEFSFAHAVPEPATLVLVGTGLVGLGVMRRRRVFSTSC